MEENVHSEGKSYKNEFLDWAKAIAVALILTIIIRTFLFAPFQVDGQSMMPTFLDGERVIVNEVIYRLHPPERGDVIVFHYDTEKDFIKRVIGIPGDKIEMREDQLYINNIPVKETYLDEEKKAVHQQGLLLTGNFGPITVEQDHLFVLGDNRRNSKDSRMIGQIKYEQVVGRSDLIFWPLTNLHIINDDIEVGE